MPIFDPNAGFKVYKGDKLIYTNAPSGSFGDALAWFMKNDDSKPESETDKVKGLKLEAVLASKTAMDAAAASKTAMDAVLASKTAMDAMLASKTAMDAVAASKAAMAAVAASETAMNAVAASETAIKSLIDSPNTKRNDKDKIYSSKGLLLLGSIRDATYKDNVLDHSTPSEFNNKKVVDIAKYAFNRYKTYFSRFGWVHILFSDLPIVFTMLDDWNRDSLIYYEL